MLTMTMNIKSLVVGAGLGILSVLVGVGVARASTDREAAKALEKGDA